MQKLTAVCFCLVLKVKKKAALFYLVLNQFWFIFIRFGLVSKQHYVWQLLFPLCREKNCFRLYYNWKSLSASLSFTTFNAQFQLTLFVHYHNWYILFTAIDRHSYTIAKLSPSPSFIPAGGWGGYISSFSRQAGRQACRPADHPE